jgi:hypothetical protein
VRLLLTLLCAELHHRVSSGCVGQGQQDLVALALLGGHLGLRCEDDVSTVPSGWRNLRARARGQVQERQSGQPEPQVRRR